MGEYVDVEMYITMKYSYWHLIQRKMFSNVFNNTQFDIKYVHCRQLYKVSFADAFIRRKVSMQGWKTSGKYHKEQI